ncbi:hypothetical protein ACFLTG_03375 [Chloroflexota bacterium]
MCLAILGLCIFGNYKPAVPSLTNNLTILVDDGSPNNGGHHFPLLRVMPLSSLVQDESWWKIYRLDNQERASESVD